MLSESNLTSQLFTFAYETRSIDSSVNKIQEFYLILFFAIHSPRRRTRSRRPSSRKRPRRRRREEAAARPRRRSGPRERFAISWTTRCCSTSPHTRSCTRKCPSTSWSPPRSSRNVSRFVDLWPDVPWLSSVKRVSFKAPHFYVC